MKKYGVIDVGTNSFHLLIVQVDQQLQLQELFQEEIFVYLAQNGIQRIGEKPYQHGLQVLQYFHQQLLKYQVSQFRALGTAALRTAANGPAFVREVKRKTNIDIELISGSREAHLIHQGVLQTFKIPTNKKALIMDIGGGSIEFIIANKQQLFWAQSFPVGAAILHQQFHQHDPIQGEEIVRLDQYLHQQLSALFDMLQIHPVQYLIGAAGTFQVLGKLLNTPPMDSLNRLIPLPEFETIYQSMIASTLDERLAMKGLDSSRAALIVVALHSIHFILKQTNIQHLVSSEYAILEGLLTEMIEGK